MAAAIFVMDSQMQDLQTLIAGLAADVRTVWLDASRHGTTQMAAAACGLVGLSSIPVLSNGTVGTLFPGSIVLSDASLGYHTDDLARFGAAL